MDAVLMIAGLFVLGIALMWVYSLMDNPKLIDQEERHEVRTQSPQEREHSRFEAAKKEEEERLADIQFYSRGDESAGDSTTE
jgi:hypothetical protein